jgi:hypothetical protein
MFPALTTPLPAPQVSKSDASFEKLSDFYWAFNYRRLGWFSLPFLVTFCVRATLFVTRSPLCGTGL